MTQLSRNARQVKLHAEKTIKEIAESIKLKVGMEN